MLESLFNKAADLLACNVIKKRLQNRCFVANIAKSLRTTILKINCERLLLPLEVFCKDFVNISYENASFGILKGSIWLQLIYFLTAIAFWPMKYIFRVLCAVFIAQISHYGKITALHKLISIVVQLANQIK